MIDWWAHARSRMGLSSGMCRIISDTWAGAEITWGGSVAELSRQQSISWSCPFDFKVELFEEIITFAPRASRTHVLKWNGDNKIRPRYVDESSWYSSVAYQVISESLSTASAIVIPSNTYSPSKVVSCVRIIPGRNQSRAFDALWRLNTPVEWSSPIGRRCFRYKSELIALALLLFLYFSSKSVNLVATTTWEQWIIEDKAMW